MSKLKHPKAVEALDLQAETKFYVSKPSLIEFQASEINCFTIWVLQQVKCITSWIDVTQSLHAFSTSNYASIIYSDLNSPTLLRE